MYGQHLARSNVTGAGEWVTITSNHHHGRFMVVQNSFQKMRKQFIFVNFLNTR
jgi:hypothetical protein